MEDADLHFVLLTKFKHGIQSQSIQLYTTLDHRC